MFTRQKIHVDNIVLQIYKNLHRNYILDFRISSRKNISKQTEKIITLHIGTVNLLRYQAQEFFYHYPL